MGLDNFRQIDRFEAEIAQTGWMFGIALDANELKARAGEARMSWNHDLDLIQKAIECALGQRQKRGTA